MNYKRAIIAGLVSLGAFASSLLPAAPAAACGGRVVVDAVDEIFFWRWLAIPANSTATFETFNLSSGSDTILHVQDDNNNGIWLGGNDDCASPARHSCVTLSASGVARSVSVLVRGYSNFSAGQAEVRISISGQAPFTSGMFNFGGKSVPGSFAGLHVPTTKVYTTRLQKQVNDSVVLLMADSIERVAAWDDDGGVNYMSRLNFNGLTTGEIIVGQYPGNTTPGKVTAVWDEGITDSDGDGLGNCFEIALGTSNSTSDADGDGVVDGTDTDNDGISDGLEVMGQEISPVAQEFPTWGADPLKLDVFVESDWNVCATCPDPNEWRITGTSAAGASSIFKDPAVSADMHVRVHWDIGIDNPALPGSANEASLNEWGNWGGANARPGQPSEVCNSLTAGRQGTWHQNIAIPLAGNANYPGDCMRSTNSYATLTHELGHNLHMPHHPRQGMNYQANYPSIMNYGYAGSGKFSTNTFSGVILNPSFGIHEMTWQGSNNTSLSSLTNIPFNYLVSGKSLDWNRNGVIENAFVKGRANWLGEMFMRGTSFTGERDLTHVWLSPPGLTPRFYLVSRAIGGTNDRKLLARHSTNVESQCTLSGDPRSTCGTFTAPGPVPNAELTNDAPALTEYAVSSARKVMVVYPNASSRLRFQVITFTSNTGANFWTAPADVDASTAVTGAPMISYDSAAGRVEVLALSAGVLKRWSYNISSSSWDIKAVTQSFTAASGGANLAPSDGVGMTWGYDSQSTNRQLYALLPHGTQAAELVRRSTTANQWDKIATGSVLLIEGRPGLAYLPTSKSSPTTGQFIAIYRSPGSGIGTGIGKEAVSFGNQVNCSSNVRSICSWSIGNLDSEHPHESGLEPRSSQYLSFDMVRDTNVRGSSTQARSFNGGAGGVRFYPLVDGIINNDFRDQADFPKLKRNIACSFNPSRCYNCSTIDAAGNCTGWVRDSR